MIIHQSTHAYSATQGEARPWLRAEAPVDNNGRVPLVLAVTAETQADGVAYSLIFAPWVEPNAIARALRLNQNPSASSWQSFYGHPMLVLIYPAPISGVRAKLGDAMVIDFDAAKNRDLDLCRDQNAALLFVHPDHVNYAMDWLGFMSKTQKLEAAVIILRGRPDHDAAAAAVHSAAIGALDHYLRKNAPLKNAIIIDTDLPLGRMNEGDLRDPYMATEAPNKIKMAKPVPDHWYSEFGNAFMHQLVRGHYLAQARAVIHLSPYDLLFANSGENVFDAVINSPEGYLPLLGRKAYTWRIRKDEIPQFGDHVVTNVEDGSRNRGWIIDPKGARKNDIWNPFRVGAVTKAADARFGFWRMMGARHFYRNDGNVNLAPRLSLHRDAELVEFVSAHFPANPIFPPAAEKIKLAAAPNTGRRLIVTTMKNEGPFILEWIAYHRAIGFTDFLVYTNDCVDGTDIMHDLLMEEGILVHKDNPYREMNLRPQHAAMADAETTELYQSADWIMGMDVDEYVNIHVGDGHLDDLLGAIGDANAISIAWRLFGNNDVAHFEDAPIIGQFNQCAPELMRSPHQAWGVKTLYRNIGLFKKMGVHRPKGIPPELRGEVRWVNGSGAELPERFIRNAWRVSLSTYGYDLVTLNHYAIRSAESFVVKRDRGRVNHVTRDQGLNYWFRMNHNIETDDRIKRMLPKMQAEMDKLLAIPKIRAQHQASVAAHRAKITELLATPDYAEFYQAINSPRMRRLSRISTRFGVNVFVAGPEVVSDEVIDKMETNPALIFNVRLPDHA